MHLAELGMAIAIAGTLLDHHIITYTWIVVGAAIGTVAGIVIAVWTPMTAMPQRTALSHAFGAAAAALVAYRTTIPKARTCQAVPWSRSASRSCSAA